MNEKFDINDKIYIKKYHGDLLRADTNRVYKITEILQTKNCLHNNIYFEKKAILSNGEEQVIYTYNIMNKEKEYYIEKVPDYSKFCCCL